MDTEALRHGVSVGGLRRTSQGLSELTIITGGRSRRRGHRLELINDLLERRWLHEALIRGRKLLDKAS